MAETIDDCLKEMRLEEELMLKYIVTTYDEKAVVHSQTKR